MAVWWMNAGWLAGYLGEISDQVAARVVGLGHDVEEERFDVIIQSFVVQEEFSQETQVLTIDLCANTLYVLQYITTHYGVI